MSRTQPTGALEPPSARRRATLVAGLVLLASVTVTTVMALRGSAVVSGHAALRRVGFGWPMPWLFQDQHSLDPTTYPLRTTVLSPWELPSRVHLGALAVDALVVLVPLLLALAVRRLRRGG
ncbi:MAG: hypothetical protein WB797_04035 [Nocardioides sp.]